MGWGGFLFSLIACGVLVWDRLLGKGRAAAGLNGKIDNLCEKIEDMEGRLEVVDGLSRSVTELLFEWRGVDGNNGYKSIIRDNRNRIEKIEKRNDAIDAVRKEDERRSGGLHRREIDRVLDQEGRE